MKLLSLTIKGKYKGLRDQHFDFNRSNGKVVAFIGLNGSGKSQLLEVIAEAFAFLERCQRRDFQVKTSLGFGFELIYQLSGATNHSAGSPGMISGGPLAVAGGILNPNFRVTLDSSSKYPKAYVWRNRNWNEIAIEALELPFVVGYSSGLNENLQRSFMKNAVQYFEIQRIRLKYRKEFFRKFDQDLPLKREEVNTRYLKKYPYAFSDTDKTEIYQDNLTPLKESATPISKLIYLDYDSAGLMLACLAVFSSSEVKSLLDEVAYKYPTKISFEYDLRKNIAEEDAVRDIQLLLDIAGKHEFKSIGKRTTDQQYEKYGIDYLAGVITLDLTNDKVISNLRERNYHDPITLFRRLYKLQQLGVRNWQYQARRSLQKDNFLETVKKPLKTKLPLSIIELELSNGNDRYVQFDDLSDGEAQLIQILATTKIFSSERTLFLFDEPETHLNPSWRTYFHQHLSKAMTQKAEDVPSSQVFLSTHSPFMMSSLQREDVLFFARNDDGQILMTPIQDQTYGASFEVLIKEHFGLKSLISQTVVEKVKQHLPEDENPESFAAARDWIETNLGDSMEKAYLLRKLKN